MKRTPKTIIERCPTCHRDGYERREHFSLYTEEEARAAGISPENVPGAPASAELCVPMAGSHVHYAVTEGIAIAKALGKPVAFLFNGTPIVVTGNDHAGQAVESWNRSRFGHVSGS